MVTIISVIHRQDVSCTLLMREVNVAHDILVIDACEMSRGLLQEILQDRYTVLFASTADAGLTGLLESTRLVLLDLTLPDANSMEVLWAIKETHPWVPVIVTAVGGTEEICITAFRTGARDYIKKPFKKEEITQKVEKLMNMMPCHQKRRHVSLLIENSVDRNKRPDIPPHVFERMIRVTDYIAANHTSPLTLDSACKMALLNKSYFCKYFKDITGHTFKSYMRYVKMQKAQELIGEKNLSVTETAHLLGYGDSSSFSRIFKKLIGISPAKVKRSS